MPQIVVSDASRDRISVRLLCDEFGIELVEFPKPSRGEQLDAGAAIAKGEILVFHHADTDFTQQHYNSLNNLFKNDMSVLGGAFLKDIVALYPSVKFLHGSINFSPCILARCMAIRASLFCVLFSMIWGDFEVCL